MLDVGCGSGAFLERLGTVRARVGVDTDAEAVTVARARCPDAEWHVASAEDLPLDERRFDALTCLHALLHVPRPTEVLRAIGRTLDANGTAWFTCNGADHLQELWRALERAGDAHPAFGVEPTTTPPTDRMLRLLNAEFPSVAVEDERALVVLDAASARAVLATYRAAFKVDDARWHAVLDALERRLSIDAGLEVTTSVTIARAAGPTEA